MYEIIEDKKEVDGVSVKTFRRVIEGANILEVEAGAEPPEDMLSGDHGAQIYFRIKDLASTNAKIRTKVSCGVDMEELEVTAVGASEYYTIISALEFIVKALKEAKEE